MNRFSLYFKIRTLQKTKSKIEKDAENRAESGRMTPNDEIEYTQHIAMIDEKIQILNATYLIEKAENLFIPVPNRQSPSWERSISIMNNWQLSPKGISDLKEAIRKERSYIIIWIAAITGLIGAFTGLIAIIKSI